MWKLVFTAFAVGDAAPVFPGSAAGVVGSIAGTLQAATNSASGRAQSGAEAKAIAAAVAIGSKMLAESVASDLNLAQLRSDAYVLTHLQVRKQLHVGGCPRDFSNTCPVGYAAEGSVCSPKSDYSGPCGSHDVSRFSVSQKEDFSFKCGVSWPCQKVTASTYVSCPTGWTRSESGACLAPSAYQGICSPTTNFSAFTTEQKARWAQMCLENGVW